MADVKIIVNPNGPNIIKGNVDLVDKDGTPFPHSDAVAFTTRPERASLDGPVSARFVEALVRGARAAALPEVYVARLERAG